MRNWIFEQLTAQSTSLSEYTARSTPFTSNNLARSFGPMHGKMVFHDITSHVFDPQVLSWMGGICSLFTGDGEAVRRKEVAFESIEAFRDWLASWYPRLDQLHDAVGVPPSGTKEVVYVVEDSIFGRRIGAWTGLDPEGLSHIFRTVHEESGVRAIKAWLSNYGYHGAVRCVYTSDLETELEIALRIWERALGKTFTGRKRDWAKVEMMYTPIWLSVLGIQKGVIVEPYHHGTGLQCAGFGIGPSRLGFLPYWTSNGASRLLTHDAVPNRGNWREFATWEPGWTNVNLEFNSKDPLSFSPEAIAKRASHLLQEVYGDESR